MSGVLLIGELAAYTGVSTRTIRFYHQKGLLPEPERNSSGYRSYDSDAVLRLTRIIALASAKVPLSRISDLLDAPQDVLEAALADIDEDLRARIQRLKDDRKRIARLRAGDSMVLPAVIVSLIDYLRSAGIDPAVVDHYRDAWVLTIAVYQDKLDPWLSEIGSTILADPEYLALMVRSFRAVELDQDDPQVPQLANDTVEWMVRNWDSYTLESSFSPGLDDSRGNDLLETQWAHHPAWIRLSELILQGLQERGVPNLVRTNGVRLREVVD